MGTSSLKCEFIKIRVTLEQKEKFKSLSKEKKKTISELLCGYIDKEIEKREFIISNQEQLEKRVAATDEKLLKLKEKMRW